MNIIELVASFMLGGMLVAFLAAVAIGVWWSNNLKRQVIDAVDELCNLVEHSLSHSRELSENQYKLFEMCAQTVSDLRQTVSYQQKAMEELMNGDGEDA